MKHTQGKKARKKHEIQLVNIHRKLAKKQQNDINNALFREAKRLKKLEGLS